MTQTLSTIRNGVDTQQMFGTLDAIGAQPELGAFTFRATNQWLNGAHNRSTVKGFFGAGGEDTTWHLWPLLWQHGGKILDGTKPAFNSDAGVQALLSVFPAEIRDVEEM